MFRSRFRGAVAPLRRSFLFQAAGQARPDVDSLVAEQRPAEPAAVLTMWRADGRRAPPHQRPATEVADSWPVRLPIVVMTAGCTTTMYAP